MDYKKELGKLLGLGDDFSEEVLVEKLSANTKADLKKALLEKATDLSSALLNTISALSTEKELTQKFETIAKKALKDLS